MKNIKYLNDDHKNRFIKNIELHKISSTDYYRLSLFYILTSSSDLNLLIDKIYDSKEKMLKNIENFESIISKLSHSTGCMFRLALKLYNDSYFKNYDFIDKFDYLDNGNAFIMINSFLIRYKILNF